MASTFPVSGCLCALVVVAGLAATGCERVADGAVERTGGGQVKIERDGDAVVVKSADGQVAVQGGESLPLPAAFPKDVYLPEGYAINSVMDLEGVNVLNLRAPGKVPELFADAREAMAGHGWKETMAMQHSVDSAMLAYEKTDEGNGARSATLSFNDGGEHGVSVSVQLNPGRPAP